MQYHPLEYIDDIIANSIGDENISIYMYTACVCTVAVNIKLIMWNVSIEPFSSH